MKETLTCVEYVNVSSTDLQVLDRAVSRNDCADLFREEIHRCSLLPCSWICFRWVWRRVQAEVVQMVRAQDFLQQTAQLCDIRPVV